MLCSVGSRHFPLLNNSNATKSRPESEVSITGPGPGVTGPPLLFLARALSKLVKCQCFRGCIPSLETWSAGYPALVGRKVFSPYLGLGRSLTCIVAGVPFRNRAMLAPGSGVPVEPFVLPVFIYAACHGGLAVRDTASRPSRSLDRQREPPPGIY